MCSLRDALQPFQKRELVKNFGVYVNFVDLEQCEQSSKKSPTGLIRGLSSIWHWLVDRTATSRILTEEGVNIVAEHLAIFTTAIYLLKLDPIECPSAPTEL